MATPVHSVTQTATNAPAAPLDALVRYHHLDAVRAFALLLGVLFHAAESFGPRNFYWAIVDCSPSDALEQIRFACHAFRLELFFLIAGFFGRLLLKKRGLAGFTVNRLKRILLPLIAGWLVVYPLLVYVWLWGAAVSGNLGAFGVPPEAQAFPVWKLWMGFFLSLGFVQKFDLTHLWFLHQLLVVYGVFLLLRVLLIRSGRMDFAGTAGDRLFGRGLASWMAVSLFALPTLVPLFMMRDWGVDTPKSSLIPELPTTLLFTGFFACGWLLHRQPSLVSITARRWLFHLAVGGCCWLALSLIHWGQAWRLPHGERWVYRLPYTLLYAHMMWALVLGFLGLFSRFCHRPSPWSRYLADSAYWVYVAHLPVVVALQVAFGRVPWPWPPKYAVIVLLSTVFLYLSYHYLVRGTWIGAALNGARLPLTWPWQPRREAPPSLAQ